MSAPNIHKDTLYVGGNGPKPFNFSSFDLEQNKITWQTNFPDVFAGLNDIPPTLKDDIVWSVNTKLDNF